MLNFKNLNYFICFILISHSVLLQAEWSLPPTNISKPLPISSPAMTPQYDWKVAINNAGEAVAAWSFNNENGTTTIYTANYDGKIWSKPLLLSSYNSNPGGYNGLINIGISDGGKAIATWNVYNGNEFFLLASSFNGFSWTPPQILSASLSTFSRNVVQGGLAVNSAGQALALWAIPDTNSIQISRFDGLNWDVPVTLGVGFPESVAMNSAGEGIATWNQLMNNGTYQVIQASTFDGHSWSSPVILSDQTEDSDAYGSLSGIDNKGRVVVIWEEGKLSTSDTNNTTVVGATYNGTSWSQPVNISIVNHTASATLAVNQNGEAWAVWTRTPDADNLTIVGVIQGAYYNGTSWTKPMNVDSLGNSNSRFPSVGINNAGLAIATWMTQYTDGLYNVGTDFNGKSWEKPTRLSLLYNPAAPTLAMSSEGNGLAIWPKTTKTNVVMQTSFFAFTPTTPLNFNGKVITNKFATQTDIVHVLTWNKSIGSSISGYQIYEEGNLIKEVPAFGPFEVSIYNRKKRTYSYTLYSVNSLGEKSTPSIITLP